MDLIVLVGTLFVSIAVIADPFLKRPLEWAGGDVAEASLTGVLEAV